MLDWPFFTYFSPRPNVSNLFLLVACHRTTPFSSDSMTFDFYFDGDGFFYGQVFSMKLTESFDSDCESSWDNVCLFVSRVGWVPGLAPVPPFAWRMCPYWIYLLQLLALFTRKNYSYCWRWAWPPNSGEGAFSLSGQTDLRSGQYRSG